MTADSLAALVESRPGGATGDAVEAVLVGGAATTSIASPCG